MNYIVSSRFFSLNTKNYYCTYYYNNNNYYSPLLSFLFLPTHLHIKDLQPRFVINFNFRCKSVSMGWKKNLGGKKSSICGRLCVPEPGH